MNKEDLEAFLAEAIRRGDTKNEQAAKAKLMALEAPPVQEEAPVNSLEQRVKDVVLSGPQSEEEAAATERTLDDTLKKMLFVTPKDLPFTPHGEEFSFSNMLGNIPHSVEKARLGVKDMITSPIDTANTLGKMLLGTGQLYWPGEQEYEKYPRALVGHYAGLLSDPAKAMEEDPASAVVDVASLMRGGNLTAGTAGRAAARGAAKLLPDTLPAYLYQKGAKFSTTNPKSKELIQTALEGGYMPTNKGVAKLNKSLNNYDTKVNELIDKAMREGKMIDRDVIYKNLNDLVGDVREFNFMAPDEMKVIGKSIAKFEQWAKKNKIPDQITPKDLQAFKHKLYEQIHWDASRLKGKPVKERLYRNLARSAKEGVEEMAPGVKELNAAWGKELNLRDALQQGANRIGNRDLFSLTDVGTIGLGGAIGGPMGSTLGGLVAASRYPRVNAGLGIGLHRLQNPKTGLLQFKRRDPLLGILQAGNLEELQNR